MLSLWPKYLLQYHQCRGCRIIDAQRKFATSKRPKVSKKKKAHSKRKQKTIRIESKTKHKCKIREQAGEGQVTMPSQEELKLFQYEPLQSKKVLSLDSQKTSDSILKLFHIVGMSQLPTPLQETQSETSVHIPVLLDEVIKILQIKENGIYIDATFGLGGHTKKILECNKTCRVFAVDRDREAFNAAATLIQKYGASKHTKQSRLVTVHGRFSNLYTLMQKLGVNAVDGILFDVGVSSLQLDTPSRGFSFRPTHDGPLDMRMDQSEDTLTAADVVNSFKEEELALILFRFGEEPDSFAIARRIVEVRQKKKITTTKELAEIVSQCKRRVENRTIDPATKTFQALRIYVNNELNELKKGLAAAEQLLRPGGRLVTICFHSLEDRIVKNFLNHCCGKQPRAATGYYEILGPNSQYTYPSFKLLSHRATKPTKEEIASNPRARSAKLRAAIRTANPSLYHFVLQQK
jgi:16S rRNA (cytosine1402-N4)-methyltransferase